MNIDFDICRKVDCVYYRAERYVNTETQSKPILYDLYRCQLVYMTIIRGYEMDLNELPIECRFYLEQVISGSHGSTKPNCRNVSV